MGPMSTNEWNNKSLGGIGTTTDISPTCIKNPAPAQIVA